ncbi:unnamed protein product [Didymodactylos carnosus]|uniref:Copper type II ascorbate-dependent monooxygenase C-terminal domain-containing protein n=1 Tax=Didymodactylos carnosus TaxID=1234261 RepID=A0A815HG55_9BILA|nr:unnamed protein product [Didymodactylos carnosus]CAF4221691.1 unnamed protein product [Didymodactylos carnosus]
MISVYCGIGRTVWSKVIRNNTAQTYLFTADQYYANYQFIYRLPKPIKLYPGDEIATRCMYSTTSSTSITLGGEPLEEEMCLHVFVYYPKMTNMAGCVSRISTKQWETIYNKSITGNITSQNDFKTWLQNMEWTQESRQTWQAFYSTAERERSTSNLNLTGTFFIPNYVDLNEIDCSVHNKTRTANNSTRIR